MNNFSLHHLITDEQKLILEMHSELANLELLYLDASFEDADKLPPMVYFMVHGALPDMYKIGHSTNPGARMRQLSTDINRQFNRFYPSSPMRIIYQSFSSVIRYGIVYKQPKELEEYIHKFLHLRGLINLHRVTREWYWIDDVHYALWDVWPNVIKRIDHETKAIMDAQSLLVSHDNMPGMTSYSKKDIER